MCDSISCDPHKTLFLPNGIGCLLVRDRRCLFRLFDICPDESPYIDHEQCHKGSHTADVIDAARISPELTREFRALRLWLPLKLVGVAAFRDALSEKISLTQRIECALTKMGESSFVIDGKEWRVEVVARSHLSVICFALACENATIDECNAMTERLRDAISARGNVFLWHTMLRERLAIRVCVMSHHTHVDHVDTFIADIQSALDQLSHN